MKKYMVLNEFEDGWDMNPIDHEELFVEYCMDVLYIPEEYLEEVTFNDNGLEIVLAGLLYEDLSEDWYINLLKISTDYGDI